MPSPRSPLLSRLTAHLARLRDAWLPRRDVRPLLALLVRQAAPIDLRILGRTLLHAAVVGLAAGLIGAGFFAGLEYTQHLVLERLAGYVPLRAHGEQFLPESAPSTYRPWLVLLLPALGALGAGLLTRWAPEARGGGGDAMIEAFHHNGGVIRRRVIWLKTLASMLTLGTGGSGGREGPTMQIGGALGSTVAGLLGVSARERRILMLAGVAAGMAAVFRTPLGAALLAVEVLYRDDFESDALVPAVLAAVVGYSTVILIFGESILFARAPRYPFVPAHLPLYGLLALVVALLAASFRGTLSTVQRLSARLPGPAWLRPAAGGLGVGLIAVVFIALLRHRFGAPGRGLGLLGGGYGAAQTAITGGAWLPEGWYGVELLVLLCLLKLLASSLTIGTGGSAGDFAPSLVLGGLAGGAFGRAAALVLHDPRIDPGAFALVGMGTFYGGIAHVPVSSLIMVCELAGSYDLLVPLMLAEGIAFVALRRHSLYGAQVPTLADSPAHRAARPDALVDVRVGAVATMRLDFARFAPGTAAREMIRHLAEATWQDVFPVLDADGSLRGLVTGDALRLMTTQSDALPVAVAADLMQPPVTVTPATGLRAAAELMLANNLRELPVVEEARGEGGSERGRIVGFLDEAELSRALLEATAQTAETTAEVAAERRGAG